MAKSYTVLSTFTMAVEKDGHVHFQADLDFPQVQTYPEVFRNNVLEKSDRLF